MTLPEQQRAEDEQEGTRRKQEEARKEQKGEEWAFKGGAGRREVSQRMITCVVPFGDRLRVNYAKPFSVPRSGMASACRLSDYYDISLFSFRRFTIIPLPSPIFLHLSLFLFSSRSTITIS